MRAFAIVATLSAASPAAASTLYPVRPRDPAAQRAAKAAAEQSYAAFERRHVMRATGTAAPYAILSSGLNGSGLDANASGGGTPPDTTGAIGPDNYVEMVNSEIAVYARGSLGTPIAQVNESTFVGTNDDTCDGNIQWDQQGQRWLYSVLDCGAAPGSQGLFFGWSKTSDPTSLPTDSSTQGSGNWCRYHYASGSVLLDYPKLGHDDSQILIGANEFGQDGNGNYQGSEVLIFDKPQPGDQSCPQSAPAATTFTTDFTPVPANIADNSAVGYVVSEADDSDLTLDTVGRVGGVSQRLSTKNVGVTPFAQPANVPQPGTSDVIDSSDTRLTQGVAVTDPSTGTEGIWTQHTVAGGGGGPSVIRWYELTPGAATPHQTGTVSGPAGTFAFNGAISPTSDGTGAVVFYNSGDGSHVVDLRAQYRAADMPVGQTTGDVGLARSGYADEDFSCVGPYGPPCRWGDYAGASPDPANAGLVWGTGELTTLAADGYGDAQWGTQNVAVGTAPPPLIDSAGATSVSSNAATISGTLNPQGYETTYHFEYGTTSAYGTRTPEADVGSDSVTHPVSAALTGLTAATVYHYTLVATSANGTFMTPDRTFTTAPSPAPTATIAAPGSGGVYVVGQVVATSFGCAPAAGGAALISCADSNGGSGGAGRLNTRSPGAQVYWVTAAAADGQLSTARLAYTVRPTLTIAIRSSRSRVARGAAQIQLACTGGLPGSVCRGTLSLTAKVQRRVRRRVHGRMRTVAITSTSMIARTAYTLRTDAQQTIASSLSRAAQSLLARSPHRLTAVAAATVPGQRAVTRKVTLSR